MHQMSVVVAQKDPVAAQNLAATLRSRFRHVTVARSEAEIEEAILKHRANAAIVDLELVKSEEFRRLCHEFSRTAVVATHRSPDEAMWMKSMELGAADCCDRADVDGMLRAIAHNVVLMRAHAA
jgi:DNA-binding NarL/FixJ family response regulator